MSTDVTVPKVGDHREEVVVENLTRTQIVQYAGASGDFNPIHTDHVFATEVAGFPGVFAHGMLTMAMTGRLVTGWFPPGAVRSLTARFRQQVWPGDTLTSTATVTSVDQDEDGATVELDLATVNQDGAQVLSGTASVRLNGAAPG